MSRKSAGPRLKICQECGEANAPRQFFCKQCSHPFYSEEYLSARASVSRPSTPASSEQDLPAVKRGPEISVLNEIFFPKLIHAINRILVDDLVAASGAAPDRALTVYSNSGEMTEVVLARNESLPVTDGVIVSTGCAAITHVSVLNGITAVATDKGDILFFRHSQAPKPSAAFLGVMEMGESVVGLEFVKFSSSPVHSVSGLIVVATIDAVRIFCVPLFADGVPVSISTDSAEVWSTEHIEGRIFPSCCDARVSMDGKCVEIIFGNNLSNFFHFFSLRFDDCGALRVEDKRVFGYNDPNRRTADTATATGTCVAFSGLEESIFFAGLSNGEILKFDLRNDFGPELVVSTLAGIRRWLVALKPSLVDSDVVLAAYQAGAVVTVSEREVAAIGGEIRTAQCFGVAEIGNRVFSALSSGCVVTCDRTVRDKLRRAMTGYIARWSGTPTTNPLTVDDGQSLEERLLRSIDQPITGRCFVKLYEKKKPPRNLKTVKASDGASNEPADAIGPIEIDTRPLAVKCMAATADGIVYGTEGGFLHFFSYTEDS